MQIVAVFARLYWYHKCNLQISAAIARLDEKCILQIAAVIARLYQKCLLQIAVLQSVAVTARRCQICVLETDSYIQEILWITMPP